MFFVGIQRHYNNSILFKLNYIASNTIGENGNIAKEYCCGKMKNVET